MKADLAKQIEKDILADELGLSLSQTVEEDLDEDEINPDDDGGYMAGYEDGFSG